MEENPQNNLNIDLSAVLSKYNIDKELGMPVNDISKYVLSNLLSIKHLTSKKKREINLITEDKESYEYNESNISFNSKTIVITDPYFIVKSASEISSGDWEKCCHGSNMEALGITEYITRNTQYGKSSYLTLNTAGGGFLGRFKSESGVIGVFDLADVLKYNPFYNDYINNHDRVTLIPHFTGDVSFAMENEEDSSYQTLHIVGRGSVEFITNQIQQ